MAATTSCIDNFIAKSQELSTPSQDDVISGSQEDWENIPPGVDPADYQPKGVPIPPPPPPIPNLDTGRVPNSFLTSSKKDIEDFFAEPGICGLLNLGNTCYMNAGLQCIRSIPAIAQFYLSDNIPVPVLPSLEESGSNDKVGEENVMTKDDGKRGDNVAQGNIEESNGGSDRERGESVIQGSAGNGGDDEKKAEKKEPPKEDKIDINLVSKGHVSARFATLLKKLWAGQFSAIVPQNFKTTFGLLYSQFGGFRQQDCQEFLAVLLDRLHEDICQTKKWLKKGVESQEMESENSIITETFQGHLKSEVICCVCGHVSTKIDPFIYLSLPLPHSNERQLELHWSSITQPRVVTKLLLTVPKLCTIDEIKVALCNMLGGGVTADQVTIAHVKNHVIESTLANSLAIKHVKDEEYSVHAFYTETTPPSIRPMSIDNSLSNNNGYIPLPESDVMETDIAPLNDPWKPIDSEDGLPAKMARNDSLEENENTPLLGDDDKETKPKVVVMEWHSCVICLEEMVDSELLTHTSCAAMMCSTCLQASQTHSANETGHMPCPVCQIMVLPSEAFVPLATSDDSQSVVRLLQLTILFRHEETPGVWSLFGHPGLLNLPSSGPVDIYYQLISSLLPERCKTMAWSLALTDGKGRFCSRCSFGSSCRGCVLSNAMTEVTLKPGDHISLSFSKLSSEILQEVNKVEPHPSLETRWPSTVSLQDCLDLFSQKEVLGSDNPWWCPTCNQNQEAIRELTISHLPFTLIVHLKRFLFHDNVASKVDTSVVFPMSLSSSSFPHLSQNLSSELTLSGCVCHFGSVNSGHYTAYSKQPVTNKWYYYNDESVTEIIPSEKDHESVYILFYHQQDSTVLNLPTERGGRYPTEEEELLQLEPLLRIMKPKVPIAPPPPPLPIKKSSSTGNLVEIGESTDMQLQQQLAASLGLDIPAATTSSGLIKRSSSNPRLSTDPSSLDGVVLMSYKLKAFDV